MLLRVDPLEVRACDFCLSLLPRLHLFLDQLQAYLLGGDSSGGRKRGNGDGGEANASVEGSDSSDGSAGGDGDGGSGSGGRSKSSKK